MAKFYPQYEDNFNNSYGEEQIFKALQSLPDDWFVFHSVHWSSKRRNGNISWGEADFVIFNQIYGMLVIEVKSGIVFCQDGTFIQERIDNGEQFTIRPFEQADRSKYEIIKALGIHNLSDSCFVDKAVWFPSIDDDFSNVNLPMEYKRELILNAKDLVDPLTSLIRVFDYYGAKRHTDLYNEDLDTIFEILIPCFKLVPAFGVVKDEINYQLDQLTDEQAKILDFIADEDSVAICGSAGTGKTFIALERARRLTTDDHRVLFLCFNRKLRDHLDNNNDNPNIDFLTIHQLLLKNGLTEFNEAEEQKAIQNFSFQDYDYNYCIIDEAQDISSEVLKRIVEQAHKENIGLSLFYDKNQLIIKDAMPEIINSFECKMTLKNNCRNTVQIIDTANSSIKLEPNPSHLSANGSIPELYFSPHDQTIIKGIRNIIDQFLKEGFTIDDITILTMQTTDKSVLSSLQQIGNYPLSTSNQRDHILFTTVRKFKGLESNCVIIVDYDLTMINDSDYSRLFYVASSRAKQKLTVFANADTNSVNTIGNTLEGSFGPIIRLSNLLKTKISPLPSTLQYNNKMLQ